MAVFLRGGCFMRFTYNINLYPQSLQYYYITIASLGYCVHPQEFDYMDSDNIMLIGITNMLFEVVTMAAIAWP